MIEGRVNEWYQELNKVLLSKPVEFYETMIILFVDR